MVEVLGDHGVCEPDRADGREAPQVAQVRGHWSPSARRRSSPEPAGTAISSTRSVTAMANTPSLNSSVRPSDNPAREAASHGRPSDEGGSRLSASAHPRRVTTSGRQRRSSNARAYGTDLARLGGRTEDACAAAGWCSTPDCTPWPLRRTTHSLGMRTVATTRGTVELRSPFRRWRSPQNRAGPATGASWEKRL
jgi:hypothetical protein